METLTERMAARDAAWWRAELAGPGAMAKMRAAYVAAGWTICEHPTCPPHNCHGPATEVKARELRKGQTIVAMPGCMSNPKVGPLTSVRVTGRTVTIEHPPAPCGGVTFHFLHAEQMVPVAPGRPRGGKRKSAPELVMES